LGQIVHETLSQKSPSQKRAGGVAQGEGPEFKPQYHKKKKKTGLGLDAGGKLRSGGLRFEMSSGK
jgi:hypothetical protein